MDSKLERIKEKLEKWFPEHKVYALDSIDGDLREALSTYAKSVNQEAQDVLKSIGFETISGDAVYELRSKLQPIPGSEPEVIKNKVSNALSKLKEYYPEKKIVGSIQNDHKNLSKTISGLYQWLGYKNAAEFLKAYGYEYEAKESGRPQAFARDEFIEKLKEKYSEGPIFSKISDLVRDNPELQGNIKTLSNLAPKLYGMPLVDYFRQAGVLTASGESKEDLEEKKRCESFLQTIQERYPDGSGFTSITQLIKANDDLKEEYAACKSRLVKMAGKGLNEFFEEKGIISSHNSTQEETSVKDKEERSEKKETEEIADVLKEKNELTADTLQDTKVEEGKPVNTKNIGGILLDSAIELSPYELPNVKPIKESDLLSSTWGDEKDACFSNGILRGPKSELERFKEEYGYHSGRIAPTEIFGIYQLDVKNGFNYRDGELYLSKVIRDYPVLKVMGFLEDWDMVTVWVVFSESGYPYITKIKEIGEFDPESEYPWQWDHSPVDEFKEKWNYLQTGEIGRVNYKCPYLQEWEDSRYVVAWNGHNYMLANLDQFETEQSTDPIDLFITGSYDNNGIKDAIAKYVGKISDVVCPDTIDHQWVRKIMKRAKEAPEHYDNIKTLKIVRGYEVIGENAFRGCKNLQKLFIPETIIEKNAFADCPKLECVVVYDIHSIHQVSEEYLWKDVFSNCPSLKYVYYLRPSINCLTDTTFQTPNDITVIVPKGTPVPSSIKNVKTQEITEAILPDVLNLLGEALPYQVNMEATEGQCDYDALPAEGDILKIDNFNAEDVHYYVTGKKPTRMDPSHFRDDFLPILNGFSVNISILDVWCYHGLVAKLEFSLAKDSDVSHISKKYEFAPVTKVRFDGQSFAFDGPCLSSVVEKQIKMRGGIVRDTLSLGTNYLVCNHNEMSKKKEKALNAQLSGKSNIKIITMKEFYEMLRKKDSETEKEMENTKNYGGIILDSRIALTSYSLPDKKPVLESVLSSQDPKMLFTQIAVRGPKSEIERFIKEYNAEPIKPTKIFGIYETWTECSYYGEPFSDREMISLNKVLHDYVGLKVIVFLDDRNRGMVDVVFSDSGYSYFTYSECIGEYNWDADIDCQWQWSYSPGKQFKVDDFYRTEGAPTIKYKPVQEWYDANYVISWGGNDCLLSNLDQFEPEYSMDPRDFFERTSNGTEVYVGHESNLVCTSEMALGDEIPKRIRIVPTKYYDIIRTLKIEKTYRAIRENAFRGCKNLQKVIIPETEIKEGAFADCPALETVVVYEMNCNYVKPHPWVDVFTNCPSLKYVYYLRPDVTSLTYTTFSTPNKVTVITPKGASVPRELNNVRIQEISEAIMPDVLEKIDVSLPFEWYVKTSEKAEYNELPVVGDRINVKDFDPDLLHFYVMGKKRKISPYDFGDFLPLLKGLDVNIDIKEIGMGYFDECFVVRFLVSLAKEDDTSHRTKNEYKFSDPNLVRFDGKNFTVDGYSRYNPSPLRREIEKRGGKFRDYVAKTTDYLIYKEGANSPELMQKAKNFKLQGLSHTEFLTLEEFFELIRKKD